VPSQLLGNRSYKVSGYICGGGNDVTRTNENSVSRTSTSGASVGDPFGIISASTEFSFKESASQSTSYEFAPENGTCGSIHWTPFFNCIQGTISGGCECGDQSGEACTAKRVDDANPKSEIDGAYSFVQSD
jgi:hypothetical protein